MLSFGIIGTNFISDRFMESVNQLPDIQVTAVYSRHSATGNAFAQKYGIPVVKTDFSAFCKSAAFDCVYIASPNICHAEQTNALLSAGKHVLCEKPATTDFESFRIIKQTAFQSHRVFMEAMRSAYDPAYTVLRNELHRIGTIRRTRFEFCQYSSRYDQYKNGTILNAFNPALGNAAVMDIGVYCIYLMLDLFGKPIHVQSSSILLPNGMEGTGSVLMQYPDMIGEIVYSKITDSILPSVFQGENGSITLTPMEQPQQIMFYPRKEKPIELYHSPKGNNMCYELLTFANYVKNNDVSNRSLQLSEQCMNILDQIRAQNHICFI